jgi:hypothetical protein
MASRSSDVWCLRRSSETCRRFRDRGSDRCLREDTAKHVPGTGEMATLGSYRLKRSLVAGEHRLELLDWPYSRLGELKAAGCFTEIIQHKTRLFILSGGQCVIERIAV